MIAGNLEYLMSSLPNLSFGNTEALQHEVSSIFKKYHLTSEASDNLLPILNAEAKKFLTKTQYDNFLRIQLSNIHREDFRESSNGVIAAFSIFMHNLKHELKIFRSNRQLEDAPSHPTFDSLPELSTNPLKAEVQLLKMQWNQLEALSIGHYSDVTALYIYKLKLELLLRWWSFNEDVGFKIFKETIKTEGYGG